MSRNDRKRIEHELLCGLQRQCRFGDSKYVAKLQEHDTAKAEEREYQQVRGIYAYSTLHAYQRVCREFAAFAATHGAHAMTDSRGLVDDYLSDCISKGQSAWTIHLKAFGLASAYDCRASELIHIDLPPRERRNITRSRFPTQSDSLHDERRETIRHLARSIGSRRIGLTRLCTTDLREKDGKLYVRLREKNGMERLAPVLPSEYDFVKRIFSASPGYPTYTSAGTEYRIFPKDFIPSNLDIHDERAKYAQALYRYYEKTGQFASGTLYCCRKERYGDAYDRGIMHAVSEALGHHRLDVITSYLR